MCSEPDPLAVNLDDPEDLIPEKRYRVYWGIDVFAKTPAAAAVSAFDMAQRPTAASIFEVTDLETGKKLAIDIEGYATGAEFPKAVLVKEYMERVEDA